MSICSQLKIIIDSSLELLNSARAPTDPDVYTPSFDEVKQLINWKPVFYGASVQISSESAPNPETNSPNQGTDSENESEPKRRKRGVTSQTVSSEALAKAVTRRHHPVYATPGMSASEMKKKLPPEDKRVFTKVLV